MRTKHDVPGADKDHIKNINAPDLEDPGREGKRKSVVVNEIEELIIRKRDERGATERGVSHVQSTTARDLQRIRATKDSLVHGHQPGRVDGWTPRGDL
jgi:hypothetical protein